MDSIIVQTAHLTISPDIAFRLFTENRHLESWLTEKANVVAGQGGSYELFWDPGDPGNNSTIGCKVLSIEIPCFINFEWKGPRQFKHFMNSERPLTNVTVLFHETDGGTRITLIHTGWRDSDEWDEAREYFVNAWRGAFTRLETYSTEIQ